MNNWLNNSGVNKRSFAPEICKRLGMIERSFYYKLEGEKGGFSDSEQIELNSQLNKFINELQTYRMEKINTVEELKALIDSGCHIVHNQRLNLHYVYFNNDLMGSISWPILKQLKIKFKLVIQ